MKKSISAIVFLAVTTISPFISFPLVAGGCNSHMNKKVEAECLPNDKKCLKIKEEIKESAEV